MSEVNEGSGQHHVTEIDGGHASVSPAKSSQHGSRSHDNSPHKEPGGRRSGVTSKTETTTSGRRSRKSDAQLKEERENVKRYVELSERWEQAKREVRHEDHELLREKVTLQQELIRRQTEYSEHRRQQEAEIENQKREAERAKKQEQNEQLRQICKQSLEEDRKKEKEARVTGKSKELKSTSSLDDVRITPTLSSNPASNPASPTKSPTNPCSAGRRSNPFKMTLPAQAPTPDILESDSDDEDESRDALPDDIPWHEQQLYKLYGKNADYFLHPKIENSPQTTKKNHSKLRKHGGRAGAAFLWQTLRHDSNQRLLQEDSSIPGELKEAYGSFARQSLRRNRIPVQRMYCLEDDLPEMPRLLDNRRLQHVRKMRHKVDLMYRASVANKDRTEVLNFNNPLPEIHENSGSVDQYLPSWQDQYSDTTEPEYLRWLKPEQRLRRDNTIQETDEYDESAQKPQVTQSMDDNYLMFMRRRRENAPKQKYLFLSEKDTRVKGNFSEKFKDERENKDIPRPYRGEMPTSYSALGGMMSATPDAVKSDASVRYSAPLPHRQIMARDYASAWQPLSMHALIEYKRQMPTLGDGDFNLGRTKMWATIPVVSG
ncbi:uncharacterized protein LOC128217219 isoform X3 [Mya arenaria]|uniref:uncharacterized protein LOC128217219 isoform X3 n=1 Tax=Mya arenaria TaxID=6604 RepID=UPI0022E1487F|nr:uncharacterized protein LOC128217219 isoform X3 [Mya arenaria]